MIINEKFNNFLCIKASEIVVIADKQVYNKM